MKLRTCFRCGQTHECVKRVSKIGRVRAKLGTQPKAVKGTFWRKGHEYLKGGREKFARRIEIYRNAGGDVSVIDDGEIRFAYVEDLRPAMCQGCAETHSVGWYEGEWHHNAKTLGGRRCDCVPCALWVCADWHVRYHNRVIRSAKVSP